MNFKRFSRRYAREIGGQFREYDNKRSVIIVPLEKGRFQTIIGHIARDERSNRKFMQLKSKVCKITKDVPYKSLLKASATSLHTKFIVEDNYLKVEAVSFLINLNKNMIKEMIQEVAAIADNWEFQVTKKDIY